MARAFNERKAAAVLARIIDGESLAKITRSTAEQKAPVSSKTWYQWLTLFPELVERYQAALAARADKYFEEIIEIADAEPQMIEESIKRGSEVVTVKKIDPGYEQQRRTMIDARKFTVARLSPKKYGDKMTAEITGVDGGPIQTAVTTYKVELPDNGRT